MAEYAHNGRPGWMAMRTSLKALSIQQGIDQDGNAKSENLQLTNSPATAWKNSPLVFSE